MLLPCSQESKRSESRKLHVVLLNYFANCNSVIDEMKRLILKYPEGFEAYEETIRDALPKMAGLEIGVTNAIEI